jgi:hypothetical protein
MGQTHVNLGPALQENTRRERATHFKWLPFLRILNQNMNHE